MLVTQLTVSKWGRDRRGWSHDLIVCDSCPLSLLGGPPYCNSLSLYTCSRTLNLQSLLLHRHWISSKGVWKRVPKSHLWRRHWTAFKRRSPPMRCTSAINFNLDRIIMTIFGEGRQISADGIGVLARLKRIPFIKEIWIISFSRHWINAWVQISKNCNQFKLTSEPCNSTHPG